MTDHNKIPLADLRRQHRALREELDQVLAGVLDQCDFIRGEALGRFEEAFARYLGVDFVLGVGSGTDAIALALAACGVGPGHEVITAANSFAATAEAIIMVGAVPVFADVDDRTLCLDPEAVERALTPRSRAIVPVHLHGLPADMAGLQALAAEHGLKVVEDAAQAHGGRLGERLLGTLGDAGCFSFFPSKNLGACGDGGAIATNSEELRQQVSMMRDHGRSGSNQHAVMGRCSRLDTLQAGVLLVKLPHLDAWNTRRQALAGQYDAGLEDCPGLRMHRHPPGAVLHHYIIRSSHRDRIREHLTAWGIATGIHYPRSIPEEPAYAALRTTPTPVADQSCQEILSLPLFPEMLDEEVDRVVQAVRQCLS